MLILSAYIIWSMMKTEIRLQNVFKVNICRICCLWSVEKACTTIIYMFVKDQIQIPGKEEKKSIIRSLKKIYILILARSWKMKNNNKKNNLRKLMLVWPLPNKLSSMGSPSYIKHTTDIACKLSAYSLFGKGGPAWYDLYNLA